MYDSIVVGSGFAGSVFARKMAEAGKRVLILEKRSHIGGNMYEDYSQNNIRVHTYGPHIFHTNDKNVFNFIQQFSEWYPYKHKVLGKIDDQLVPIPFNFTSIKRLFPPIKANSIIRELTTCYGLNSKVSIFDLLNSSNTIVNTFGEYVFTKVFVNYTTKQWGTPPDRINTSTLNRIPVTIGYDDHYFSDKFQYMPKEGYTNLFQNMLNHPNITVQLNVNALQRISLDFDTNHIYFDHKKFTGILLYSGSIDELLTYKLGSLPYRSLSLKFEDYEQDFFQSNGVVNYPNEELYTRITEFKYLTGQISTGKTTIMKEYPLLHEHATHLEPYYPINNSNNDALYQQYASLLAPFTNILLCGRLAEYSYYNMDIVISNALRLAENILKYDHTRK